MEFTPNVYFVTPVYGRFALTKACMEQRREMLDALPFPARQVVIGDENQHRLLAEDLGFDWVEKDNTWVSAKFNAGYGHALRNGASHVMAVGSDSFLHQDAFAEAKFHPRHAIGMIGLSSVSPWGDERIDLQIKYPAGFGVGMIYPAWAIKQGGGAAPQRNRGIDTSTWGRCGRGRVQISFLPLAEQSYVNFHSPADSITDYYGVRGTHRHRGKIAEPWGDLIVKYGEDRVRAVQEVYVCHALGVFFTGVKPEAGPRERTLAERRKLPGHRGRKPHKIRNPEERGYEYGRSIPATRREVMVENFRKAHPAGGAGGR